jgi:hypothetical protein
MWRGWGDLRIAPRRVKPLLGDHRIVVEMNEKVGDARMAWLALEDRLQDHRSFELIGITLVARRGRDVQRNRVQDLRFVDLRAQNLIRFV